MSQGTTLGSSETPANHNIELQEHSEPHVATIQAEAIPFDEGKQTYLVNAEDVHVHPDHIPLTSSTNSYALDNRGVVEIRNPDGSVGYIYTDQTRAVRSPTGQPPIMIHGYQGNQGPVVFVNDHHDINNVIPQFSPNRC